MESIGNKTEKRNNRWKKLLYQHHINIKIEPKWFIDKNICITILRQWHAENALMFAKYSGFYSSKTPSHKTNCILCGYITNSRDHRPFSNEEKEQTLKTVIISIPHQHKNWNIYPPKCFIDKIFVQLSW